MNHSKAPWKLGNFHTNSFGARVQSIDNENTSHIADVYGEDEQSLANIDLIVLSPIMLETLRDTYLYLQIISRQNTSFAVKTDELRASLRNIISRVTHISCKSLQEEIEAEAVKSDKQ